MLLAGSLCSAILSPLAGKLMDRRGIRRPFQIGSGFLLLATLSLAGLAQHLSVGLIIGLFVGFQIGFSCLFNNALTYGLQQLPPQLMGDGNALFNTLQQYSGSLGTAIMAVLITFRTECFEHDANHPRHPDCTLVQSNYHHDRSSFSADHETNCEYGWRPTSITII